MSEAQTEGSGGQPVLGTLEREGAGGGLDARAQALLYLLRVYTLDHRTARIDKTEFCGFVKANAGRYALKMPQMEDFLQHTEGMVDTYLRVLADGGLCTLEKEEQEVRWIFFPQYFIEALHKLYGRIEARPSRPFPAEDELQVSIPDHLVTEVNVRTEFAALIGEGGEERPRILRLSFPELIRPLLVSSDLVERKLMDLAVAKLRVYLESKNNASYALHRLHPALRGNERALRDMVTAVMTKSGRAIGTLTEPSDFSFRFWAHFANLVLQEYKEVSERTAEEHSYCQAAYLVGLYNVHYRNRQQKKNEKQTLFKRFETRFHKYPYAYTVKDLYNLRDEKGFPLVRKATRDVFLEFLESKTKTEGYEGLPELVRVKTVNGKNYYVHRDLIVPLFVKMLHEKAGQIRDLYVEEWESQLRENNRSLAMADEQEFTRDLEITVKNQAPFFYSLLNYNLLYLARELGKISYDMARTMDRVLDEKQGRLLPLPRILGLDRKELLGSAKLRVPLWRRLTLFRGLFQFFRKLFRGIGKAAGRSRRGAAGGRRGGTAERPPRAGGPAAAKESGAQDAAAVPSEAASGSTTLRPISSRQLAAYRRAVQDLKQRFVGPNKTLPESLKELVEKWNPLYDPKARTDLVEDVNAMIRDYMRNIKRTFRLSPPDAPRIRSLAAKLAANKSFLRITRKDPFTRYIEIYMIKLLGER